MLSDADGRSTETAEITLSGRLFLMVGPVTGKADGRQFDGWHQQTIGSSRAVEGTPTR